MPSLLRRLSTSPVLLLAASVLVPALLTIFAIAHDRNRMFQAAEEDAQQNASFLAGHATSSFEAFSLVLAQVDEKMRSGDWTTPEGAAELRRFMTELVRAHRPVDGIWVMDAQGTVRATTRDYAPASAPVTDREYFTGARDSAGALFVGTPLIGRVSGQVEFPISVRRTTPDGNFDGVIALAVNQSYFNAFYANVAGSPRDAIALYRRDGTLLARYPKLNLIRPPLPPDNPVLAASRAAQAGIVYSRSPVDQVDRIVGYERVTDYPLFVFYGVEQEAVLRTWRSNLVPYAAAALLATLALIVLSAVTILRGRREAATARRLDEELRRSRAMQAALVESEKLKSIGQMTGGIAHDFNNLLTVISGNLEMIAMAPERADRVARLAALAGRAAERGERLIQQLLMFSRRQVLKPEIVSPNRLLRDLDGLIRRALGEDIMLDMKLDALAGTVRLDPAQFEAAILNLIVNARDAMTNGGVVRLESRPAVLTAEDPLPLPAGAYVVVTVADEGSGIDPAVLPRVFEPFFTTKDAGKGSGLGLSQVYGFAQEFGGHVVIANRPGGGAEVKLYLPAADTEDAVAAPGASAAAGVGGETILVVDDDPEVLDVAIENLGDLGYRVWSARDGREALERLRSPEPIDLLFTDVVMPGGLNGEQLAQQARQLRPGLKVLLTSAYPRNAAAAGGYAATEALEILGKPYRRDDLAATLRRVLSER